jgi:hypothetical protein
MEPEKMFGMTGSNFIQASLQTSLNAFSNYFITYGGHFGVNFPFIRQIRANMKSEIDTECSRGQDSRQVPHAALSMNEKETRED